MIIDDRPVVRLGVRRLLEPGWEIEELADGRGAAELVTSVGHFDVAVIEMRPHAGETPSGTATIRALLRAQPGLGVVAHGGRIEAQALSQALAVGASAYVSKRSPPSAMVEAVEAAAALEPYVAADAVDRGRAAELTKRQRQILQLFADGLSTEQTARRLELSAETVRTHAKATLARLGARDRAHAVAIAMRCSMIE